MITIIIPLYNAATFIAGTLDSVLAQTLTHWEVLIADDGSTDNSLEIARSYADRDTRIRIVPHRRFGSPAKVRNYAYQYAHQNSAFVIFLDHDDTWEPEFLASLLTLLDQNQGTPAAHTALQFMGPKGEPLPGHASAAPVRWSYQEAQGLWVDHSEGCWTTLEMLMAENCIFSPGQVLMRREAFERAGGFDASLPMSSDWYLWLQLTLQGKLAYFDAPLFHYRKHSGNYSSARKRLESSLMKTRGKLIACPLLSEREKMIALMAWKFADRNLIKQRRKWIGHSLRRGEIISAIRQAGYWSREIAHYMKRWYLRPDALRYNPAKDATSSG